VNFGEMLHNSIQWQPFAATVWNFRLHGPLSLASFPVTRQRKEENADWKLNSHNHVVDRRRGINSTSDQEDRYVGFGAVSIATMLRDGQSGFQVLEEKKFFSWPKSRHGLSEGKGGRCVGLTTTLTSCV
jgi:hypothetical protein